MKWNLLVAAICSVMFGFSWQVRPIRAAGPAETESGNATETVPTAEEIEHFEKHIRPLLHQRCYSCHSTAATTVQGGLRLDSRAALMQGGDSGPVIAAAAGGQGLADQSLLIQAIRYEGTAYDMPPEGKLSDAEIALLTDWVSRGAPYPVTEVTPLPAEASIDFEEGRRHWAFQPLAEPAVPATIADPWSRGRIDAFVLAKLQEHGLSPSPAADRATLIRRLSFNLIGLPPTPEELEDFVRDDSPDAYDRLVERLLGSPQYGERWGRMWLDLARYSDVTESWLEATDNAHLYRDWVVKAFNDDLPYDQFVRRQLATDLMAETGLEDLPALGFLGLSPTYFKELLLPPEIIKVIVADEWEERVDAVTRTFLGLTVACARCHDHKFDPISHRDYHALAGVIASTRMTVRPMIADEEYAPVAAAKAEVAKLTAQIEAMQKQKPVPVDEIACLQAEINDLKAFTPQYDAPLANAVVDESLHVVLAGDHPQSGTKLEYRPEPQDLNLFIRGNPNRLGPLIPRGFLTVLSPGEPIPFRKGSGRLELADAIVNQAGHLAARVIVNRVWQMHFGRGLVDTPSNFGRLGSKPSHPELLEDLTARFVANGWSIKTLHREILHSATYAQSSAVDSAKEAIDPDNRWWWRMNRRRLEVEPWRDAMLAVAGTIDLSLGGRSEAAEDASNHRRTVYLTVHRREVSKLLQLHDFPDPNLHSSERVDTTTPLQGLYLLNSPLLIDVGRALAARLLRDFPDDPEARVREAYRLMFGRAATAAEVRVAIEYLAAAAPLDGAAAAGSAGPTGPPVASPATPTAWERYSHALLASNEFLFID
jgi:hypothetical protein